MGLSFQSVASHRCPFWTIGGALTFARQRKGTVCYTDTRTKSRLTRHIKHSKFSPPERFDWSIMGWTILRLALINLELRQWKVTHGKCHVVTRLGKVMLRLLLLVALNFLPVCIKFHCMYISVICIIARTFNKNNKGLYFCFRV